MSQTMSMKQTRGTKRTCQDEDCGARFYDLNRTPIVCPICGTEYELASAPAVFAPAADKSIRKPRKPDYAIEAPAPVVEAEAADGDEALAEAAVDADAGEPIAAEADETFLEEEEEEGDVSNILGGPVAEGEEEP